MRKLLAALSAGMKPKGRLKEIALAQVSAGMKLKERARMRVSSAASEVTKYASRAKTWAPAIASASARFTDRTKAEALAVLSVPVRLKEPAKAKLLAAVSTGVKLSSRVKPKVSAALSAAARLADRARQDALAAASAGVRFMSRTEARVLVAYSAALKFAVWTRKELLAALSGGIRFSSQAKVHVCLAVSRGMKVWVMARTAAKSRDWGRAETLALFSTVLKFSVWVRVKTLTVVRAGARTTGSARTRALVGVSACGRSIARARRNILTSLSAGTRSAKGIGVRSLGAISMGTKKSKGRVKVIASAAASAGVRFMGRTEARVLVAYSAALKCAVWTRRELLAAVSASMMRSRERAKANALAMNRARVRISATMSASVRFVGRGFVKVIAILPAVMRLAGRAQARVKAAVSASMMRSRERARVNALAMSRARTRVSTTVSTGARYVGHAIVRLLAVLLAFVKLPGRSAMKVAAAASAGAGCAGRAIAKIPAMLSGSMRIRRPAKQEPVAHMPTELVGEHETRALPVILSDTEPERGTELEPLAVPESGMELTYEHEAEVLAGVPAGAESENRAEAESLAASAFRTASIDEREVEIVAASPASTESERQAGGESLAALSAQAESGGHDKVDSQAAPEAEMKVADRIRARIMALLPMRARFWRRSKGEDLPVLPSGTESNQGVGSRIFSAIPSALGIGRKKRLVVVEIGTTSLKIASFEKSHGKRVLEDYSFVKLESRSLRKLGEGALEKLTDFVEKSGLKGSPVIVTISSNEIICKGLSFPKMSKEDLKRAIEIDLKKSMNLALEEIVYGYDELKPSAAGERYCLVTAVEKGAAQELRRWLKRAALRPKAFLPSVVAYSNILNAANLKDDITGLVDFGAESTALLFFRRKKLLVTREISVGGNALTESLMEIFLPQGRRLSLSFEDAEALKIRHGMPLETDEAMDGNVPLSQVRIMLRPSIEKLVGELERSLQYIEGEFPGQAVGRVFLTGGASKLKNFKEYLDRELALTFEELNMGKITDRLGLKLPGANAGDMTSLAVIAGAFLSNRLLPNLLKPERPTGGRSAIPRIPVAKVAAVAGAALFLILVKNEVQLFSAKKQLKVTQDQLAALLPTEQQLDLTIREKSAAAEEERAISQFESNTQKWSFVLMDLSNRLPPEVKLTGLFSERVDPENGAQDGESQPASWLRLEGVLYSRSERHEGTMATIMKEFLASPVYEKAILKRGEATGEGTMNFTIYLKLRRISG
ncbi:MAG: pilus assembly protein PilM [Candidatus Eisenbacteria bacterium]|nr:pilus assembly protein PilM [Candidatus Eisenbacteria bacterium]